MLAFNETASLDENKEAMTEALAGVVSGSITHAIRDTQIDGIIITDGDFLGMVDGRIVASMTDVFAAGMTTLKKMITDETEIVTIIIGEEGSQKEADAYASALAEEFPDIELEIYEGNQPVYPYLFAAE